MENPKPRTFESDSEELRNPPMETTELTKRIDAYEKRLAKVEQQIRDIENRASNSGEKTLQQYSDEANGPRTNQ